MTIEYDKTWCIPLKSRGMRTQIIKFNPRRSTENSVLKKHVKNLPDRGEVYFEL